MCSWIFSMGNPCFHHESVACEDSLLKSCSFIIILNSMVCYNNCGVEWPLPQITLSHYLGPVTPRQTFIFYFTCHGITFFWEGGKPFLPICPSPFPCASGPLRRSKRQKRSKLISYEVKCRRLIKSWWPERGSNLLGRSARLGP